MWRGVRPLIAKLDDRLNAAGLVSHDVIAAVLVLALLSAWATELIGVHALFGAFVFGAILPRGILTRTLMERLEALVVVILLPLFFAYSGLRTQIGLLASASDWIACAAIIMAACVGKFGGTTVAARATGSDWREATALGVLMNTRGLMELIVLNIGLDLGVLSPRLFTMMVLMALGTTFMTTPLLRAILGRRR
jgi:Kef-type K+ transport system membrane component KefB